MTQNTLTIYHGSKGIMIAVPEGMFRLPHADVDFCFVCYWKFRIRTALRVFWRNFFGGEDYIDVAFSLCEQCAQEFETILPSDTGIRHPAS